MATIGVTGHQALEKRLRDQGVTHSEAEAWAWVDRQFAGLLSAGSVIVSSLAAGTDQRLTRVALASGCPIEVVVPSIGYEATFSNPDDRDAFDRMLHQAWEVFRLGFGEPSEEAFYAAGKRVVERCDQLVAVWDGADAAGLGGTADVVRYAQAAGKAVVQLDPIRLKVRREPGER